MLRISLKEQLERFKNLLQSDTFDVSSPVFIESLEWIRSFPGELTDGECEEIKDLVCRSFSISRDDLYNILLNGVARRGNKHNPLKDEEELMNLIPKGGYLYKYCKYTSHSEAPLAFHLFCAMVGVGALLNRRVWFDMGYYRLFPNISIILIGRSGVKKTSAGNIILNLLQELKLVKIYSEKITPEQLVEAMLSCAQGLIYAPEMAVFLGKQRYNEGLVPLITRFLDCPDHWKSETVMRGSKELVDIAISSLMCTTSDWFVSNTPHDTFGGGFIARNLMIVQDESPRIEPIPDPGSPLLRNELLAELARIYQLQGRLTLTPGCDKAYRDWYTKSKKEFKEPGTELLATYYQRKPDHVKRLAFIIHLSQHMTLEVDEECFNRALAILEWTEKFLPSLLKQMFRTEAGVEADTVYRLIVQAGGIIDHHVLVREMQHKMNVSQLRNILQSLKEGGQINEKMDKLMHIYYIKEITDGQG